MTHHGSLNFNLKKAFIMNNRSYENSVALSAGLPASTLLVCDLVSLHNISSLVILFLPSFP